MPGLSLFSKVTLSFSAFSPPLPYSHVYDLTPTRRPGIVQQARTNMAELVILQSHPLSQSTTIHRHSPSESLRVFYASFISL